jgi:hypothetical protein
VHTQIRTDVQQAIDITPTQLIDVDAPYGRCRRSDQPSLIPSQLHQTQTEHIGDDIKRKMQVDRERNQRDTSGKESLLSD